MLHLVLFFLDYALITVPLFGLAFYAILRWQNISKNNSLYLSFGLLPFPLLLITYVLSALIVNGPHGKFDLLRYIELCVQAFPFHVALFGIAFVMRRRNINTTYFIYILGFSYLCAAIWQFLGPYS